MAFTQFNQLITGSRKTIGTYVNGVWIEGAHVIISILTSVQPSNNLELQLLPEGRREQGAYTLRSTSEIINGDMFTINSEQYEVLGIQVWQNKVIPHYLAVAVRTQL